MLNILSVDVEDYHDQLYLDFQGKIVPPTSEALKCTDRLLELFDEFKVAGTFFILGKMAEHFPKLIARIADQGHHLGIHGYYHHLVSDQTADEFRNSIDRAKKLVEDIASKPADAYRATAFSINESTPWAIETLIDLGFKYDSSVFPFKGRRYGDPNAPRIPYKRCLPDGRSIWEIPLSTVDKFGQRHFPLWITDKAIQKLNNEQIGAVVYLHPYETEPAPEFEPMTGLSFKKRCHFKFFNFHQLHSRKHTIAKLRYLLKKYPFGTIEQAIAAVEKNNS